VKAKSVAGGLTSESYGAFDYHPALQRATETALQDGLAAYEKDSGRAPIPAPEAKSREAIRRIGDRAEAWQAAWQQALEATRLPLYDVHWPAAVIVEKSAVRAVAKTLKVAMADGRVLPCRFREPQTCRLHDVVLVRVIDAKGKSRAPSCGCGRPCRVLPSSWRTSGPHPGDGRWFLLSAEQLQSCHPVAAPARPPRSSRSPIGSPARRVCSPTPYVRDEAHAGANQRRG